MSYYELLADDKKRLLFEYRPTPTTNAHFHSAYELLFCPNGGQEVLIGGERKILQAGEACFADAYTVHSYLPTPTPSFVIVGSKEYFAPTFQALGGKIPPKFFAFSDFALLRDLMQLQSKIPNNTAGRYETNAGIIKILLSSIAQNTPFKAREGKREDDLIIRILQYSANHLQKDLSLQSLAQIFGYSREHLSRILHKALQESWNGYVGRLRAQSANAMLAKHPEASVLEIAFACGFDSPNTFYRAYKKEYSCVPRRK